MRRVIENSNEENAERLRRWEENLKKGVMKQNSPPPPKREYHEFDARMLEVKRLYCAEHEPAMGQGKKVRWIEQKV